MWKFYIYLLQLCNNNFNVKNVKILSEFQIFIYNNSRKRSLYQKIKKMSRILFEIKSIFSKNISFENIRILENFGNLNDVSGLYLFTR